MAPVAPAWGATQGGRSPNGVPAKPTSWVGIGLITREQPAWRKNSTASAAVQVSRLLHGCDRQRSARLSCSLVKVYVKLDWKIGWVPLLRYSSRVFSANF